jgi:MoaA/NifB/PqqE/SkfB family radical SAM enzyme
MGMEVHSQAGNLSVAEDVTELILDGTKIGWHMERVKQWERGEKFAPITIDMALTRACNYACGFCYAMLQENDRHNIDWKTIRNFLFDAKEAGVKAVSFVSDGESTLSPVFFQAIQYGHEIGLDMAVGTNGWILTPDKLDEFMPYLTYLRFNISAGTPERYAEIMGTEVENYHRVMNNAKAMMAWKKENPGKGPTVGFQMVLPPQDGDQIIPLANAALEAGVDYAIIKHTSDDETGSLGIDYEKYEGLHDTLRDAEAMSTDQTLIRVKWSKLLSGEVRSYSRCYGAPFILQISGSGLVAPCGMLFNSRYGAYHIGNIVTERFRDILKGDAYWTVMNRLASPDFDAQTMCGTLCLQHKVNEALDNHVKGDHIVRMSIGKKPDHVNFI